MEESAALVHATPATLWRAPGLNASREDLEDAYASCRGPVVAYGHIHTPFVRRLPARIIADTGSVGLPYDGDRRAAYLSVDGSEPNIRRVGYDVDREIGALRRSALPHADWTARMLATASFVMPKAPR